MAKELKVGEKYYLPVTVERIVEGEFGVTLSFADGDEGDTALIWNAPDLLLTANEIAENIAGRRCAECLIMYDEVKARNAELEALLKEVMETRDEAIRQNDELIADRNNWKEAAQKYRDNAKVADAAADELRSENKKLMAAADKLKDTLVDRTKDVQHLTEENAKLQNKVSEFQNRVGEQLAQIQDLNAEVHFHKEFGEGLDKQQKELQARYDELDSVNHEQAEKIRRQDKALTDLKQRNDKLRDENTNLSFLLEAQPEEEATRTVHVFTNDGTEVEFRRYTDVTYRTDYNILVIKDGEEIVAGFIRGDRPGNLAYWWTE